MSELILLRNKIHSIQNIQKITHTMQLIAMSSFTAFRKKEEAIRLYTSSLKRLLSAITTIQNEKKFDDTPSLKENSKKTLCIVIGSQKGLCSHFNTQLKQPVQAFIDAHDQNNCDFIVIGNQAIKIIESLLIQSIIAKEPTFNHKNRESIVQDLLKKVITYDSVFVISNRFKTFFDQEVRKTKIFPIENSNNQESQEAIHYIFDEPIENLQELLTMRYINAQLSLLLYQSLLSEYAARFASMESATRNAHALLEQTKTTFNKLRQAKITTEITELTANF